MQVNFPPSNFNFLTPQQPGLIGQSQPAPQQPLATTAAPGTNDGTFVDMNPLDQRQQLAAQALEGGTSTKPGAGWAAGLARLAQAVGGGMNLHKANQAIAAAKGSNAQVMKNALDNGDWETLATADNDTANKLGDSLLQAQLKHMQTERLLTQPEISAAGLPAGTVASKSMNGEVKILNRPNTGLPKGYQFTTAPDGSQIQTFIPGGPADPAIIAKNAGGRAAAVQAAKPKKAAGVDQSTLPPWERTWK